MILDRNFYSIHSTSVARNLIGKILVRNLRDQTFLKGIIVETEAYGGLRDPASHAYGGMTSRNQVMFGEAGFSYVYFTYGFHHCLNVVTGRKGIAQAVLLRAIKPIQGIETMQKLRGKEISLANLTNGPGKICQALKIDRSLNGIDMTSEDSPIFIENSEIYRNNRKIARSERIGISVGLERKWRFYDSISGFVSHRSKINLPME